ncbi:unnamed protein product [Eretmochelys imbricata]
MERHLAVSPEDPFLCGACWEKREELQALEDHRARGAFVRSRIRLLRKMDRGSCFFYALEKTRGPRNTSPAIINIKGRVNPFKIPPGQRKNPLTCKGLRR